MTRKKFSFRKSVFFRNDGFANFSFIKSESKNNY